MSKPIAIDISECLVGQNIRYDSISKTLHFCVKKLGQHLQYRAFCPAVDIDLSAPRKIKNDDLLIPAVRY